MAYQIIQVTKEEWAEDTWPHIHVRFTPFSILEKNIVSLPDAQLYYIVIDDTTYNSAVTSQEAPGRTIDAIEYSIMGESLECLPQRRVETLAEYAHTAWAGWLAYMLNERCIKNEDGTMTIPAFFVERWLRQSTTSYADLPEAEKESDRDEARAIIGVLNVCDIEMA